jgi:hypothetical protein
MTGRVNVENFVLCDGRCGTQEAGDAQQGFGQCHGFLDAVVKLNGSLNQMRIIINKIWGIDANNAGD